MTDHPILMSGPMVRALLDGRKAQTRRLAWRTGLDHGPTSWPSVKRVATPWQKRRPGDKLWVREKHWCVELEGGGIGCPYLVYDEEWSDGPGARLPRPAQERVWLGPPYYDEDRDTRWGARPSIHMPRWASRITLVVTDVRRERVQEISRNDCGFEGFRLGLNNRGMPSPSDFQSYWDALHRKPGHRWADNPEVVALTFTVHKANIDSLEEAA